MDILHVCIYICSEPVALELSQFVLDQGHLIAVERLYAGSDITRAITGTSCRHYSGIPQALQWHPTSTAREPKNPQLTSSTPS